MRSYFVVVVFAILWWSCEPKPNANELVKQMVVTTDFNSSADFSNYSTYTMVIDTMSYFDNSNPNPRDTTVIGPGVQNITRKVKNKMDSVGYSLVSKKADPDLRVYIYVNEIYSAYQSYYYNPYSFGYYGSYYPTVSITDQADLYIYVIDLKHKTSGPYIWACDIGDLVSSPTQTTAPILRGIDQAFKQSPYFKK